MFKQIRTIIVLSILVSFFVSSIQIPAFAQIDPMPFMPQPGVMVPLSPEYTPAYLKGIVIHPENALKFDFIIYKGDKPLSDAQKRQEYTKLTKYFLASLAIPDSDQWVNLSPYEKDRIIKDDFGKTEMGRDLLAQDYLLKQITASLIYPQESLGKTFWDKVYTQAQKQYGTTNIPVNTFNKVWILPDDALIYEKGNTAYVLKNHLRVMLEEDYLSLQKHSGISSSVSLRGTSEASDEAISKRTTHTIASQIIKEIILPELQREVNEDQNFAPLRQVYSGMLLATWFKRTLKQSLLGQIYANKAKVKGVEYTSSSVIARPLSEAKGTKQSQQNLSPEQIYRQYLKAYKKGVFNFIKEDVNKYTNETIPRKYFSGGLVSEGIAFPQGIPTTHSLTIEENKTMIATEGQLEVADFAMVEKNSAVSQNRPVDAAMRGQDGVMVDEGQIPEILNDYIEAFTISHDSQEALLYLEVLRSMYKAKMERFKGVGNQYEYSFKAEFAGELFFLPMFKQVARKMLQDAYQSALRLDDTGRNAVVLQIIKECSLHPELRGMAVDIINDPRAYGLNMEKAAPEAPQSETPSVNRASSLLVRWAKGLIGTSNSVSSVFPVVHAPSKSLFLTGLIEDLERPEITAIPESKLYMVITHRADYLLTLVNDSVMDDPQFAEKGLSEYLRLVQKYMQWLSSYLRMLDFRDIFKSRGLRPFLIEMANNFPNEKFKREVFTALALQMIDEGDFQGALDHLEEVGVIQGPDFVAAMGRLMDVVVTPSSWGHPMAKQILRIIGKLPGEEHGRKVELLVLLAKKLSQMNMSQEANKYYQKAWEMADEVPMPVFVRLKYLVPVMRQQGIRFPESRGIVLRQAQDIGEAQVRRDPSLGNPYVLKLVAKEYALEGDLQAAESVADFLSKYMRYPRDHVKAIKGYIMQASIVNGDQERAESAASQMDLFVGGNLTEAAESLVESGDYEQAMQLAAQDYHGMYFQEVRIARRILQKDMTQTDLVKRYLEVTILRRTTDQGIKDRLGLISEYSLLDPDGSLAIRILWAAYQQTYQGNIHDLHVTILRYLRDRILNSWHATERIPMERGLAHRPNSGNRAMISEVIENNNAVRNPGGIDLNSTNLNLHIKRDGNGVPLPLAQQDLAQLSNIEGLDPVILSIKPASQTALFSQLIGQS